MHSLPAHHSKDIFLETKLRILIAILFMCLLSSCTDKSKMHDNFWGGMFYGASQMQETKNEEPVPPPGEERPTYEQYKKERQELLKAQNRLPPQE
jgi:hypothetical protein